MPNKNTIKVLRLASVAVVALAAALILPMTVGAAPPSPLNPASNIARDLSQLFWIVLAIAGVVFVIVEGLLIYTIIRYRRRYEHEMPEQIHGNPTLEIVWTVIPTLIMIALFVLTLDVANRARQTPDDAYVIEVVGRQWFWEFSYPDTEITIFTPADDLFIPADTPVEFQITGGDVIHSFWVPEIAGKYDAIPGTVNVFWVTVDEGTYAGQCAEFCGLEHYNMLFDVRAVPQAEFDEWMAEKVAEAEALAANTAGTDLTTELPPGDAARGELLFGEGYNCISCHSLDGTDGVGPSIQGLGDRAATRIADYTAQEYLRESILLPCDYVVAGYPCVMPQDYGERMTYQDLADLIAYLLEN